MKAVTDKQIHALRDRLIAEAGRAAEAGVAVDARAILADCNRALQKRDRHWTRAERVMQRSARARCAAIINASD